MSSEEVARELEALDGAVDHYYCSVCAPDPRTGDLLTSLCGIQMIAMPNAGVADCPECVARQGTNCERCGVKL